jgi:hypothetical protein
MGPGWYFDTSSVTSLLHVGWGVLFGPAGHPFGGYSPECLILFDAPLGWLPNGGPLEAGGEDEGLIESHAQRGLRTGGQQRPDREAELITRVDTLLFEGGSVGNTADEHERILALGHRERSLDSLKPPPSAKPSSEVLLGR